MRSGGRTAGPRLRRDNESEWQRRQQTGRGDLTQGSIGPTLLKFALPTLASSILQSLNGTVNAIWVGRFLGEGALAATSNANMVMFLLIVVRVRLRHGLDDPHRPGVGPQGHRRRAAGVRHRRRRRSC